MKKLQTACLLLALIVAVATAQIITVTKPAANDPWIKGKSYTIQWTKQGEMPNTVRVVLWNPEMTSLIQVIADPVPNSGSRSWTVPASLPNGSYRIKVRASDTAIEGISGVFTIGSSGGTLSPGIKPGFKTGSKITPISPAQPLLPSVKILRPAGSDSYHQLDTIMIEIQANTGPADGSGDGFDVDLYNEAGKAKVTEIHSGGIPQSSPGVYSLAWKMPRMDNVPDGRYTIRARSWLKNIAGVGSPFWIRIPGTEEKFAIQAVIADTFTYRREPTDAPQPPPGEHVAEEKPGMARIGFYNSSGGQYYLGVVYRGTMQFPMNYLEPKKTRFSKATLRLKQSSFGVRKNVGDLKWTIGQIRVLQANWTDFWNTPSTYFKEVPRTGGAEWTCDITEVVRTWLNGTPNHGLLLTACDESFTHSFNYAVSFFQGTIELTFFNPVY